MSCTGHVCARVLSKPVSAFFFWIILTTILPNFLRVQIPIGGIGADKDGYLHSSSLYQLNSEAVISNGLSNSDIVIVTAHPDDESMFFTPTILELAKLNYNNNIHLLCFSNGNYDGLGEIRQREIVKAAGYLGISSVKVLNYEDNITKEWDQSDISTTLKEELGKMPLTKEKLSLLTFDEQGVSGHPNHRSLFHGVLHYMNSSSVKPAQFFKLKTWPIYEKYSSFFWVNFQLIYRYLDKFGVADSIRSFVSQVTGNASAFKPADLDSSDSKINIFNDLNGWFVSLSTMAYAHFSQIVWYRWIWIFLSKYLNSNELVPVFIR
ncbi:DEKNAAC102643 [Brettanomyces naardenensis]|uniref:N-acetylglucosaminylphosphatidylinositol deacetylase n=1 Tax=Brettanomyces naardenensis TaxID=13370 RepID=A0A448YKL8_BRENA|nr:DEKNAAC102643 [Brettanomyces naardenensis]